MASARPRPQVMRLTDAAADRIKAIMAKADKPFAGVRVGVRNGGCAGMAYTMEYAESAAKFDEVVEDKGAIVSFELKNAHPHDVATIIDRAGVAVRAGTHCAMPLLARYGVTATCRAPFGLYNTRDEVDSLVQALNKAQDMFA